MAQMLQVNFFIQHLDLGDADLVKKISLIAGNSKFKF